MTDQTLLDLNRRNRNFTTSKVKEVLPEHYTSDYPNLVKFLDYYYDWMETDINHGFDNTLHNLYKLRDLSETDLVLLNQIFKEIGQGSISADYFTDPRQVASLLSNFYKIKGSLYSAEGFFRAFYREQPQIVYPKNSLFIVGESQLGPESLKYMQNGALYQVLSVLVKSATPIGKWRDLYKSFVHPSGFYLGSEVIVEGFTDLNMYSMPLAILDEDAGTFSIDTFTSFAEFNTFSSITAIYPDGGDADSSDERLDLNAIVSLYQTVTIEQLDAMYNSIQEATSANNPRFDDDSAVGNKAIKFSNTVETMDGSIFDNLDPLRYIDSDEY
tara:strand:- start:16884 stop:17867 length:984 start_codon:yes stop_codon:yes gene_type:complete